MPTCPGCRRQVTHGDIPMHERYCPYIWAERAEGAARAGRWGDHLARSVQDLELRVGGDSAARLATRVERLEKQVDGRPADDE